MPKSNSNNQISLSNLLMVPHHVAIRICIYAAPRCKKSESRGAGGDGFSLKGGKWGNKNWSFPIICEEVVAYSRFVLANSVKVCWRGGDRCPRGVCDS